MHAHTRMGSTPPHHHHTAAMGLATKCTIIQVTIFRPDKSGSGKEESGGGDDGVHSQNAERRNAAK